MNYDEAVKIWASKRIDISFTQISRVTFEHEHEDGGCPTCGSYVTSGVEVAWRDMSGREHWTLINLEGESFASVLAEILEAAS